MLYTTQNAVGLVCATNPQQIVVVELALEGLHLHTYLDALRVNNIVCLRYCHGPVPVTAVTAR